MPPAKTRVAHKSRAKSDGTAPTKAITRKEVEESTARFEKALEEASDALQALGQDLGKGAQRAYKDLATALRALRRDAQKTSRTLVKDVEKLAAAVSTTKAPTRSAGKSAAPRKAATASKKKAAAPRRGA